MFNFTWPSAISDTKNLLELPNVRDRKKATAILIKKLALRSTKRLF